MLVPKATQKVVFLLKVPSATQKEVFFFFKKCINYIFWGREFCKMVRKIFIYTTEEVKKMNSVGKLPLSTSLDGEGTIMSLNSELKSES